MFSLSFLLVGVLAMLGNALPSSEVTTLAGDLHPFNHPGLDPQPVTARAIDHPVLDNVARDILARATPLPPHFLIYGDRTKFLPGPPDPSLIKGFNVFALAFLLTTGPADQAGLWAGMTTTQRASIKAQYAAAGIKLIVSAFGSTETPTTSGIDPISAANTMGNFVINFDLDGIDVDYEDFTAFNGGTGSAENWLISFTTQLRTVLPQGTFILTHAPVAPWFSPNIWGGGGYLHVDSVVGSLIDWYNIQFYNQGTTEYTTCTGLLNTSSTTWPQSAVFQIAASGVQLNKIVIGKPATTRDAHSGFIDPAILSGCVSQAAQRGWSAGVMVWQYPDANGTFIQTVRSTTFP